VRPFGEYVVARDANRAHFAETYPYAAEAFNAAFSAFGALGEQLRTGRDVAGKSHISLAPFFFILQRQTATAFDAVSANQAYAAWVAVRTGVESALIIGKWVDDKRNADIWERRFVDRKAYQTAYQGRALRSRSLPRSDKIQGALTAINDRFLHPNPEYYKRHLTMKPTPSGDILMELNFFDDQVGVETGLLGILHLNAVVQDSLAALFGNLFVGCKKLDVHLADLEAKGADFRRKLGEHDPETETILTEIGLWNAAT
jgi:hypothetical protein